MKIAVELLRSGWRVGQLAAIRRFATRRDVKKEEAAILAAFEQLSCCSKLPRPRVYIGRIY